MPSTGRHPAATVPALSRLTPSRSARPWGGGRFGEVDGVPVGELWVSGDEATLDDGRTLAEAGLAPGLPLVKLLDVAGTLSVQVHPDDATARGLHGPDAVGKHECWVVLDAPPDARIALGLVPGTSVEDLFSGDERRIVASLRSLPVARGSVLDIPPGTVHAPSGGLLLYEIQQRSDLTYRIWDWGRPRPLHLDESRRAIRADSGASASTLPDGPGLASLSDPAAPFRLDVCRLAHDDAVVDLATDRAAVLSVIDGPVRLATLAGDQARLATPSGDQVRSSLPLEAGSHWLLPEGRWTLRGSGLAFIATARPGAAARPAGRLSSHSG